MRASAFCRYTVVNVLRSSSRAWVTAAIVMTTAQAAEVAGVSIPDRVSVQSETLLLNGAGVRKRFFVKVYVGALYLPSRAATTEAALVARGPKSVRLHFLYKEVAAEKLVAAWNEGFAQNTTEAEHARLEERIAQFNRLFPTVRRGDRIRIDLLPDGTTQVLIDDALRGTVAGADFQQALLKIWLGDQPADADLKQAMLGKS